MKESPQRLEYRRYWVAARRKAWFKDKTCVKCGSAELLELHHIDPRTKISNSIWGWSKERQNSELAKCEVLCRSCHSIKTREQRVGTVVHGTRTGYMKYKCRCPLCTVETSVAREKQRIAGGRKHQPSYMPK